MNTLALIDTGTGEVVAPDARGFLQAAGITDLAAAEVEQLAQFIDNTDHLRRIAAEAKSEAGDELIARMDRNGRWTLRTPRFAIKSSSPQAGTIGYDVDRLHDALIALAAAGVISREGSWAALEPVHPTVAVSYNFLRAILPALDGSDATDDVYEEVRRLLLDEPEMTYRVKPAGVNALLKVPAARQAIEACQITTAPPRRVARVKRS